MSASRHGLTSRVRAFSSSCSCRSSAATYAAPLKPGQVPAYDEALALLHADRETKLRQLEQLSKSKNLPKVRIEQLEVSAWVNDPETRWKARHGHGDLSKPVFRHLAQRHWRNEGALAILMQRVTQMSVIPDVVPAFEPVVDVRIHVQSNVVEPGSFVVPGDTRDAIEVSAQVFHPDERLYTLLLVDPDVPDELNRSFTTLAHWMIPNIPLSATNSRISSSHLLSYIPPHPQQGTPYHRYVVLLLEQEQSLQLAEEAVERHDFSVRDFVHEYGLEPVGISFFRQKWDKDVSDIYRDVLGVPEPRFGRPPKVDSYANRPKKYEVV